jgi:hypothetical protein
MMGCIVGGATEESTLHGVISLLDGAKALRH